MSSVYRTLSSSYGIRWCGEDRPIAPDFAVIFENSDKEKLHKLIDKLRSAGQFELAAGHYVDYYWLCYETEKERQ